MSGVPVPISCWPPAGSASPPVPESISSWPPPPSATATAPPIATPLRKRRRQIAEKLMEKRDAHTWPEIAIARALRNKTLSPQVRGAGGLESQPPAPAPSVHTKIAAVMQSKEGISFLVERSEQLEAYIAHIAAAGASSSPDPLALAVLGATLLCVGSVDAAVTALDQAVSDGVSHCSGGGAAAADLDDDGDDDDDGSGGGGAGINRVGAATLAIIRSRRHRAWKQQCAMQIQRVQLAALASLLAPVALAEDGRGPSAAVAAAAKMSIHQSRLPTPAPVARVDGKNLTREQFYESYAKTGTPVIITGPVNQKTKNKITPTGAFD